MRAILVGNALRVDNLLASATRAIRFDASGLTVLADFNPTGAINLDTLAIAVNAAGTAVGYASRSDPSAAPRDQRAVRWDAGGVAITELGNLGTDAGSHIAAAAANAINDAGTIAGYTTKYVGGTTRGNRAVRWDAGGTSATELGNIGTNSSGATATVALAINASGTIIGYGDAYSGNTNLGSRAIRWEANGLTATELGNLGTSNAGTTAARANAINDANTSVGYASKYVGGTDLGERAVRWDAGTATATELGNLGTNAAGVTASRATDVDAAGDAVGYANKYVNGINVGTQAVRWNAGNAVLLGNLGTDVNGNSVSFASAINAAGIAVGYANRYASGATGGTEHAVAWGADGVAIDLNTVIGCASGWTLTRAIGISDTNWITGFGVYDPDGTGPITQTAGTFLLQLPEPTAMGVLALPALAWRRRR